MISKMLKTPFSLVFSCITTYHPEDNEHVVADLTRSYFFLHISVHHAQIHPFCKTEPISKCKKTDNINRRKVQCQFTSEYLISIILVNNGLRRQHLATILSWAQMWVANIFEIVKWACELKKSGNHCITIIFDLIVLDFFFFFLVIFQNGNINVSSFCFFQFCVNLSSSLIIYYYLLNMFQERIEFYQSCTVSQINEYKDTNKSDVES